MIIPQTHGAEQLDMGAEMFGQDGQEDRLDTSDQMGPFCTVVMICEISHLWTGHLGSVT